MEIKNRNAQVEDTNHLETKYPDYTKAFQRYAVGKTS
jgi:hypothetical protein